MLTPLIPVLAALALAAAPADTVPLYTNLGTLQVPITTAAPLAQRYFDQGMRLTYAFNHPEAIRSFEAAIAVDPMCAMCWWGVAFALGPNINAPMDSASGVRAYQASREAARLSGEVSAREQAYIRAIQARYAIPPASPRAALDTAYALAMVGVAQAYPDDPDAQTLAADALMNLSPWFYWLPGGQPRPATLQLLALLEAVIARLPDHPGACHLYIHAVEAAEPGKAVPCAERLAGLMPGAGHLVHMPAHIYIRVGRFADAVTANEHAVHVDESYLQDQRPTGIYAAGYYPHNYHFLSFAATMSGQRAIALQSAQQLSGKVSPDIAEHVLFMQSMIPYYTLSLVTFGQWEQVFLQPMPPANLPVAVGLVHYARGVAYAATGRPAGAAEELAQVNAALARMPEGEGRTVLTIAVHSLQGEIALRSGQPASAVAHFTAARDIEDGILYNEPPFWYYPVRLSLGQALLAAGQPAEAERAYLEDLALFPENVWGLVGLRQSLEAQGKPAEAALVQARLDKAGASADIQFTGSRF
jgi:tetratricopeptide (TPR) repeat protein